MSETHLIEQAQDHLEEGDMEMDEGMYKKTQQSQQQMGDRATESLLSAGKKDKEEARPSSKQVPSQIVSYIQTNNLNAVVKSALNQVLREMPADPLSAIAGQLFAKANKSYPEFDHIRARRVFLHDLSTQTLELKVFLTYQGRTELRHTHRFTFDECQLNDFIWDSPDQKTGLTQVCKLINEDVNLKLKGVSLEKQVYADNKLGELLKEVEGGEEEKGRRNIVRACSEAIMFAVAKCFDPDSVYKGFLQSFYPRDLEVDGVKNTKLLVTVLNGGKSTASAVKYSKFYLVVDVGLYDEPLEVMVFYQKFITAIKSAITSSKAGEAGFKVGVDGAFNNANASIAESFKMLEDAIALSGANDNGRKVFKIGINCEADNSYNKDAKDPNKYEQEGSKTQFDMEQMLEYYSKMLAEHPLLCFIEDAFAQFDFEAHRKFREKLSNEHKNVDMSLRQVFARGGISRMRLVTDYKDFQGGSQLKEHAPTESAATPDQTADNKSKASKKGTPTPAQEKGGKKTPATKDGPADDPSNQDFPEPDPENPNKHRCTPDCAALEMSQMLTMSQVKDHFVHASNLDEEIQFSLALQDCQYDTHESTEIVDLAVGLNAQYLVLKGCTKNEKLAKIQRFLHVKDEQKRQVSDF